MTRFISKLHPIASNPHVATGTSGSAHGRVGLHRQASSVAQQNVSWQAAWEPGVA